MNALNSLFSTLGRNNAAVILNNVKVESESLVVKNHFVANESDLVLQLNTDCLAAHKTKLNMTITGRIMGYVVVKDSDSKAFHSPQVECFKIRSFNILKNGQLVMPTISVRMPLINLNSLNEFKDSFKGLKIEGETAFIDIDLTSVNLNECVGVSNIEHIFDLAKELLECEAKLKVLNSVLDKVDFVGNPLYTVYQASVLEKYGVTAQGLYNPISVALTKEPKEAATEITFQFKGLSALPKIEDAISKPTKNFINALMVNSLNEFNGMNPQDLIATLKGLKLRVASLRYDLCVEKVENLSLMVNNPKVKFNDLELNIKISN